MDMSKNSRMKRERILSWLVVLLVVGAALGFYGWYKFFREVPQEDWVTSTPEMRFRYGSIGGERDAGIPYWIFYVLPRVFPEKLPGPGGYASLGVSWEQGRELPIGFTKKTVGFARVGNTCAVCHTTNYRASPDENPVFINAGPGHTLNLVAFFRFLVDCAKDPRFNADVLMREIDLVTDLPWDDRLAYRFLIIPMTKKRLIEREEQFAWIYRKDFPDWGRGRDDSMNLTKYFMLELADGRQLRSGRHTRDLEPEEVQRAGHDDESCRRQPRRLFGDHRLRTGRRRRGTEGQRRVPRPHQMAAGVSVEHCRRRSTRSRSTLRVRRSARPCSNSIAPVATRATRPAAACRSPASTPTRSASAPGTRAMRSRPTRS